MNKDLTKRVLQQAGIPVVEWRTWYTYTSSPSYSEVRGALGETVVIKPANAGSSMGVSKVRNEEEYEAALDFAAKHDTIVLIERAVDGVEVQIALRGKHEPKLTEICEIESTADFHDFEDKYSESSTVQFHIPARLSPEQTERVKRYATDAYHLTRCEGMARIDFFITDDNTEYLNEINSIPGFTNVSVYPKLWRATGVHYPQLIDALIHDALMIK
jgi:D-alanine-D-alanine ligase